jgi:hypothetical protein
MVPVPIPRQKLGDTLLIINFNIGDERSFRQALPACSMYRDAVVFCTLREDPTTDDQRTRILGHDDDAMMGRACTVVLSPNDASRSNFYLLYILLRLLRLTIMSM